MTAKEFLQQYQDANRAIDIHLADIRHLRDLATRTTTALSPDKVQMGSTSDKLGGIIAKIADEEARVDSEIDALVSLKTQVLSVIREIPKTELREVLARRYIRGQKWEEIAVDMSFAYRWVLELHGRGLQAIEKEITKMHINL